MIENLLNFFIQHIVFFIVLIFGLSQFFLRKTIHKERTNRKDSPQPMPPVSKPFFEDWLETDTPKQHPISSPEMKEDENSDSKGTIQGDMERISYEEENVETGAEMLPEIIGDGLEKKNGKLHENERSRVYTYRLSNDDVVNGLIWAEVLGPPRARKKYSHRKLAK